MAQFPYTAQGGFETGAVDSGFALTDTQSKTLGYMHYTTSMRKHGVVPFRGAYCWGVDQSLHTTADCNQTVAAMNVADGSYWAARGAFYLQNITMAADARVTLVKSISAGADEGCLQLYYTAAGGLQLLLTQANDTAVGTNPVCPVTQNEWHVFEIYAYNKNGAAGTLACRIDGQLMGTVTGLTNAAITDTKFGSMDAGAGEFTVGKIFFDDLYCHLDTAAVRFGTPKRFPASVHVSAIASQDYTDVIFVGPGTVREISLLTAVSGDTLRLYDTDSVETTGTYNFITELTVAGGVTYVDSPIELQKGCTVVLHPNGAAGARALVTVDLDPPSGFHHPLTYGNEAILKMWAMKR